MRKIRGAASDFVPSAIEIGIAACVFPIAEEKITTAAEVFGIAEKITNNAARNIGIAGEIPNPQSTILSYTIVAF